MSFNISLTGWFLPKAPQSVRLAAGCMLFWGILLGASAGFWVCSLYGPWQWEHRTDRNMAFAMGLVVFTLLATAAAVLIIRRKRLGVILAWLVAVPSLVAFPVGTALAVYTMINLPKSDTADWLNGGEASW